MKFKSDIKIQAGVEIGGSTGTNGQVLSSTGTGVAWIDQSTQDLSGYLLNTTVATNTTLGLIKLFNNTDQTVAANAVTTTANRTYGLQLNSSNQAVINVPWTDTNTWRANAVDSDGYVAQGSGQANKVWKTDATGNPAWRTDANTTYTAGTGINLDSGAFRLQGGEIPGSVDLNTYRTTGIFCQNANADAASGSNYPTDSAGILEVYNDDYGNGLFTVQRYSKYNSINVYQRQYYNGTWYSWRDLTQDTNTIPTDFVSAANGGTFSGDIFATNLSGTNTGDQDLSGYALTGHNHDDRYYTESEANSRFVNVTGDTMTGRLNINTDFTPATNLAETKTKAGININAYTTGGSNSLTIGESSPTSYFIQHANSAGTTAYNLALNPYGGNVGIGTTNPGDKLDVDGNAKISGRVEASQVRVNGNIRPLVLTKTTTSDAHIAMIITGEVNGFIASKNNHIGIGRNNGYSTDNLNISKTNGYVGIKQKAPKAPLHVKRNGEAIRLESTGDNQCSIDFRQGTNKRGHIEFDNSNDTLEIQTENPTGSTSKIKFSVTSQGQDPEEVMRIQSGTYGEKQVVIGNIPVVLSQRELYVSGDAEVTRDLWVGRNAEINGRCHADSFKVEGLNTAPGSATAYGKQGEIRFTADYIYVCVSENNWKRTALTSW